MPDWRRLSWTDRLAWFIGAGFGSGFSPLAPGTAGAAAAVVIYWAVMLLLSDDFDFIFRALLVLAMAVVGFVAGLWATGRMSTVDNPDPPAAVWDEFVGMWVTLLPTTTLEWQWSWLHPSNLFLTVGWTAAAFFLFRALDTLKPWPCRRLERLHGGLGIMLDDVAAGVWALIALQVLFIVVAMITLLLWGAGVVD